MSELCHAFHKTCVPHLGVVVGRTSLCGIPGALQLLDSIGFGLLGVMENCKQTQLHLHPNVLFLSLFLLGRPCLALSALDFSWIKQFESVYSSITSPPVLIIRLGFFSFLSCLSFCEGIVASGGGVGMGLVNKHS